MEELSQEQREELRGDLLELARHLEAILDGSADEVKPVSLDLPIGRISRVDAIQQQNMARASRRSSQVRLRQVRSALTSFDQGGYGVCRECDEPIGYRRLKARPEAPFCVECHRRREQEA